MISRFLQRWGVQLAAASFVVGCLFADFIEYVYR